MEDYYAIAGIPALLVSELELELYDQMRGCGQFIVPYGSALVTRHCRRASRWFIVDELGVYHARCGQHTELRAG